MTVLRVEKTWIAGKEPLPEKDPEGTPKALAGLRKAYRLARAREEGALMPPYQASLKDLETGLTQGRRFDEALVVRAFRESLGKPTVAAAAVEAPKPAVPPRPADAEERKPGRLYGFGKMSEIRASSSINAARREDGSWLAWGTNANGVVDKINSLGPVTDLAFIYGSPTQTFVVWIQPEEE